MLPDRQECNQAYEYVRTIMSAIRPDGVPVVFGLRRVPGALDSFTAYLEYLSIGDINAMPHTGELKRAVREAFGSEHNRYIGDGTVPILEEALLDSQVETILLGIDKLKSMVPAASSDYWKNMLSKWHNLFARYNSRDSGEWNEECDDPDIYEDDNSEYEWEQDCSSEDSNRPEETMADSYYNNSNLHERLVSLFKSVLPAGASVMVCLVLILVGTMVKDRCETGQWNTISEALDGFLPRKAKRLSNVKAEQPQQVLEYKEERINRISTSCCYCNGGFVLEFHGFQESFDINCPYCYRSIHYTKNH